MIEQSGGERARIDTHDDFRAVEVMLREANHRIANSLQQVMAACVAPPGNSCEDMASSRETLTSRIAAIGTLHRMLSVSGESGPVAFGDYLEELAGNIGLLWAGIRSPRIVVHHTGETVDADVAMRLGMVINELITNSLKYAYADRDPGEIRIGFSISDARFVLIVADDGAGIDPVSTHHGLGTRIMADLARRMDARLDYHPGQPGTIAVLSGPADMLLPPGRYGGDSSTLRRNWPTAQMIDIVSHSAG